MNYRKLPISKWANGVRNISSDNIACETLVKLWYNDDLISSLLASPEHSEYLLRGHLAAEGYVSVKELMVEQDITKSVDLEGSISVKIISEHNLKRKYNSTKPTTTSCGACNLDGLQSLISELPLVDVYDKFDISVIHPGLEEMKSHQVGFSKTGGMHCAGLLDSSGKLLSYSEDIGRHNAVDKVIGKSLGKVDLNRSILLLSGRCGWDIVAKAARCNIANIASIGACSTMASDCARSLGITIFSFVKENSAVIIG